MLIKGFGSKINGQKEKIEYRVIAVNKSGEGLESNTVMAVL